MKKVFVLILTCLHFLLTAQNDTYLWPVANEGVGNNILYRPQDYIGDELNTNYLVLGVSYQDTIQSPFDGVVTFFRYRYHSRLNTLVAYKMVPENYTHDSMQFATWKMQHIKYISVVVGIRGNDGKSLYISGIRPIRTIKTGEKIKAGDVIGMGGYFYNMIPRPALGITISDRGKVSDPLLPFGLKSNFKPTIEKKYRKVISAAEALFDYRLFIDALQEGMPDMYDYIPQDTFRLFVDTVSSGIKDSIRMEDFKHIIHATINKIRDSHLAVVYSPSDKHSSIYVPSVAVGWFGDSLLVNRTLVEDTEYYGKKVVAIDGVSSDSIKETISQYIVGSDGYVESYSNYQRATLAVLRYSASKQQNIALRFADGKTKLFKGIKISKEKCVPVSLIPNWIKFFHTNYYNSEKFVHKRLSKNTAYIGLSTFQLNEIEVEVLTKFIRTAQQDTVRHLIIDLRNNAGGSERVLHKLFASIAHKPFRTNLYTKVTKKANYSFFKYCNNLAYDSSIVFPEYKTIDGKNGYYKYTHDKIQIDSLSQFRGRVYVLVNERSVSAAANFAALVKKYERGVIVGRETASTYHQIKALKFAKLRLPYSAIVIKIPLVKIVFDTLVNDRFPWGRGVLPDYPINLSLDELAYKHGDSILNYTKHLIEDDKYLDCTDGDKAADEVLHNGLSGIVKYIVIILIVAIGLMLVYILFFKD